MSKWPGKFVIGLTGNIGTGKSVVRRMLENLGAYGIDADALAHRAIARGAPGYRPILNIFGQWILNNDEEIDRGKLGRLVFADPDGLRQLEEIVHPLVEQAIDILIRRSTQKVIVVEAIKLLEAGLGRNCDSIWAVYAPPDTQLNRLMTNRKMSAEEAGMRIEAQPSQEGKIAAAQVVIKNTGGFEETWKQVSTAWQTFVPGGSVEPAMPRAVPQAPAPQGSAIPGGELSLIRARPKDSAIIASLVNRMRRGGKALGPEDILAAFGEKAFMLLQVGEVPVGVVGWQVENLVTRVLDVYLDPLIPVERALPVLINDVETASRELQSEAALVFAPMELSQNDDAWSALGYVRCAPESLSVPAWREAAGDPPHAGTVLYFKQLRLDRVLRPI